MRYRVCVLATLLALTIPIISVAEVKDKPVSSLRVVKTPDSPTMDVGEPVDLTGLQVAVTFEDGEEYIATGEDFTVEGYNPQQEGSQLILLRYGTYPTTIAVTVKKGALRRLDVRLVNKNRYVGETISRDDFIVTGQYESGKSKTITDFGMSTDRLNSESNQVIITYGELSQTVNVNAMVNTCVGLKVEEPGKSEFRVSEDFSTEGLKVVGTFRNGAELNVTRDCEIEEPDMTKEGNKTVRVKYGGRETSYQIKVQNFIFDYADVSEYEESGVVYLYFVDKEEPIPVTDTIWFSDEQSEGKRNYTIHYGGEVFQASGEIPEEARRYVGSFRVRAQVPIGINVVSDENGTLGYVCRTSLQNKGDSAVQLTVDIVESIPQLNGLPQTLKVMVGGRTDFPLDIKNEKAYDIETKYFRPFSVRLEVPNE